MGSRSSVLHWAIEASMEADRPGNATGAAAPPRRRVRLRCSACGQVLESRMLSSCPLCGFDFHDDRATGADVTPYAKAFALGEPGWARMCEWIWFAGWSRLKHMMLMRASAASRQFAFVGLVCLALSIGLYEGARVGWKRVARSPVAEPAGSMEPLGNGWFHVAAAPRPLPSGLAPGAPVDLWWNPVHTIVAGVIGIVAGSLSVMLVLFVIRVAANRAHKPRYRDEQRLTAALHYGFAWAVPVILAAWVTALRPISSFGVVARWSWYPPERVFDIAAAVLAGFGLVMWWFWLVCIGNAAPKDTRGRVVWFLALGAPMIVMAGTGGWWFGMDRLHAVLFSSMDVLF